jgi:mRNA-degrading endonuclease RelE of RelBE toxin-antitoxin system
MMTPLERFELIYPPIIKQYLASIDRKYYSLIKETLETQLQFQPDVETKNRKTLQRPVVFEATWEVRFGPDNRFRAFYRIDYENEQVILLAIGEKIGNRLFIGGEEVEI